MNFSQILNRYFICWKNENIKYDILMKFLWIFHVHQDSIKIWKFHKNIIWNSWTAFAGFSYHITNRAQNRIHPRWPLLAAPPRASNGKPSSSPIPCPHPSSIPTPSIHPLLFTHHITSVLFRCFPSCSNQNLFVTEINLR